MTSKPFTLWAGVFLLIFQVGYTFFEQDQYQEYKVYFPTNSEITRLIAADPSPEREQVSAALRRDRDAIYPDLSTTQRNLIDVALDEELSTRIVALDGSRGWKRIYRTNDTEITPDQIVAAADGRLETLSLPNGMGRLNLDFSNAAQCDRGGVSLGAFKQNGKLVITVQNDAIQSDMLDSGNIKLNSKSLSLFAHRIFPNLFKGGSWHNQQAGGTPNNQISLNHPADRGMLIAYQFDHRLEDGPLFEPRINLFVKASGLGIARPITSPMITRLIRVGEDDKTAYAFLDAASIAATVRKSGELDEPVEELSVVELVSFHHPDFRLSGIFGSPAMVTSAESRHLDRPMPALPLGTRTSSLSILLDPSNPHANKTIAVLNPNRASSCMPDYSSAKTQYVSVPAFFVSMKVIEEMTFLNFVQLISSFGFALLGLYLVLTLGGTFRATLYARLRLSRFNPELVSWGIIGLSAASLLLLTNIGPAEHQRLITPVLFLFIVGLREFVTSRRSEGGKPDDVSIASFDQAVFLLACTTMLGLMALGLLSLANIAGWFLIVLLGVVMLSRLDAHVEAKR